MSILSADDITQAEHYTKQTVVKQWLILMLYNKTVCCNEPFTAYSSHLPSIWDSSATQVSVSIPGKQGRRGGPPLLVLCPPVYLYTAYVVNH